MTAHPPRVLIVEDEAPQRSLLEAFLKQSGLDVDAAAGVVAAKEALEAGGYESGGYDAVVTDFRMPDGTGLDVLAQARALDPATGVILVSAFGTVPMAVEAMRGGAFDVLVKPVDPDALVAVIRRAVEHRRLLRENEDLRARLGERVRFENVVAESAGMQGALSIVRRVAPTAATVLVTGESGTGKELVAVLLHRHGKHPKGPFVAVNVAALPEGLLESELFGHARGAFTGAVRDRPGRFEEAEGGTIFLDEVAEVPPAVQVRLLRVLQAREVVRVGENKTRPVDLRVVAATNRDIEAEVKAGRFREDLYYRLNVVRIHLPPLRERRDDIPPLVVRFASEAAARHGVPPVAFPPETLAAIRGLPLPGNVRELQNLVERIVLLHPGATVAPADIHLAIGFTGSSATEATPATLDGAVEALERRMIATALKACGGIQTKAADSLGIGERVLRYKMQKYGMVRSGPAQGEEG